MFYNSCLFNFCLKASSNFMQLLYFVTSIKRYDELMNVNMTLSQTLEKLIYLENSSTLANVRVVH